MKLFDVKIKLKKVYVQIMCKYKKASQVKPREAFVYKWSHLGSNQGPLDYEKSKIAYPLFSFDFIYLIINAL